jgi:hypothetical protein
MTYAALKRRSSSVAQQTAGRVQTPTSGAEARDQGMDFIAAVNRCATQKSEFFSKP